MELGPVCEGASRCIREWIWVQGGKALGFRSDLDLVSCDFCPCRGGWWQQGQGMVWMESGEESSKSWEKGGRKEQVCLPSEEGRI